MPRESDKREKRVDSACTGHILRKTKGTKNDNNTNAKQDQKYNTSQTIEDNEWFMDTGTCRKTPSFLVCRVGFISHLI